MVGLQASSLFTNLWPSAIMNAPVLVELVGPAQSSNEDLSAIQYARLHGLSTDSYLLAGVDSNLLPNPPQEWLACLSDDSKLFEIKDPGIDSKAEKLSFARDAFLLLSGVRSAHKLDTHESDDGRPFKRLKLELPILRSDHELDTIRFGHPVIPNLRDCNIPFESVDQENDEGLEWPTTCHNHVGALNSEASTERIVIPKSALSALVSASRPAILTADDRAEIEALQEFQRVCDRTQNDSTWANNMMTRSHYKHLLLRRSFL